MRDKKILIISPEKWGNNFVSKHHYAACLAKENEVFFLNPVEKSNWNPLKKAKVTSSLVSKNLTVVDYDNPIPKLNDTSKKIQSQVYKKLGAKIQKALDISQFNIVWSFDPYRFWDLTCFQSEQKIYHMVDSHAAKFELDCINSSDLCLASSTYLIDRIKNKNKEPIYVSHGAHLGDHSQQMIELPGSNSCKIGLVANFHSENLDLEKLYQLVKTAQADFILIGPKESNNLGGDLSSTAIQILEELEKADNVYFLGSQKPETLASYSNLMDINLILYKNFEKNISPHKIMPYLLGGKVILASKIHDIDTFPSDSIICFEDQKDAATLNKVLEKLDHYNSNEMRSIRKDFAESNSYDIKVEAISTYLKNIQSL